MIAPAHADILQLFSGRVEVCAANERRWCIHGLAYTTGGVYKDMWLYTSPVYISHDVLQGPITLRIIMDRFGSAIASMTALPHADILHLFSGPSEVCAADKCRQLCI